MYRIDKNMEVCAMVGEEKKIFCIIMRDGNWIFHHKPWCQIMSGT